MPIQRIRPTFTFDEDRLAQLRAIVPEAFADGKINWDTLREALGEHLEDEGPDTEYFGLFWPGKREARRLASTPSKGTLVPQSGEGINEDTSHNIFIEGDNLEVLKLLQKSYAGRVKMMYIDPPYNTGDDRIYPDDYSEPLEAYLRRTGQADAQGQLLTTNPKASGRFHSNWLSMMYPRLRVARQLLRKDGAIVVSIDNNELHHLRLLMNEVFGEENFITKIVIQSNPRGRQSESFVATVHEYLVVYAKEIDECVLSGAALTPEQIAEFKYQDEQGRRYRLLGLRQRGSASRREDRPAMFFPIYVDPDSKRVSLEKSDEFRVAVLPRKSTGEDGRWMWGTDKVARNLDIVEARLISTRNEWDIFVRDFLASKAGEERTRKFKTIWVDKELNYQNGKTELKALFEQKAPFEHPKPVELLRQILIMAGDPQGLYMDFVAGSGTLAHAVIYLNHEDKGSRNFICIQLPELVDETTSAGRDALELGLKTIADVCRERIRRVIARMQAETADQLNLHPDEDLGFKCYRLDRSNFRDWHDYAGEDLPELQMTFDQFETPLAEGWQPAGLLTEILLIEGFPVDSTITRQIHFVHNQVDLVTSDFYEHRLFVCLDQTITPETLAQLDLAQHDIFVCLDSTLTDETKLRLSDTGNLHVI